MTFRGITCITKTQSSHFNWWIRWVAVYLLIHFSSGVDLLTSLSTDGVLRTHISWVTLVDVISYLPVSIRRQSSIWGLTGRVHCHETTGRPGD